MPAKTVSLRKFLATATDQLSVEERQRIVDQAIIVLEQLYAHLPLKRARHAVDPLERLSLLRRRAPGLDGIRFHREILSVFNGLKDLHTLYTLPEPFRSKIAFLPLLIEEYFEGAEPHYILSKLGRGTSADAHFVPGVAITHWNAVPIRRAIEVHGERAPGGNEAANRAIGLQALTHRALGHARWPDEEWVVVGYRGDDGEAREARFEWRVAPAGYSFVEEGADRLTDPEVFAGGISRITEEARRTRKKLYGPLRPDAPKQRSRLPDNFSFRAVRTPHGDFGYIRIWSFEGAAKAGGVEGFVDAFVDEFVRILDRMPPSGLILDVRGNPGGRIPAGERILELLSPIPITPASFHFRSTPLVQELCRLAPRSIELDAWEASVAQAIETGSIASRGYPFIPFARRYNRASQRYHGPVVLIVDALAYSTTDIFAAGFQDHAIGPVLGTDAATGAGGANVWTHEGLTRFLSKSPLSRLEPLPGGASFTVALRQSTRVGPRAGMILEDMGVVPDHIHRMTRKDLIHKNADLIAAAGALLADLPARALGATAEIGERSALTVTITANGLNRVDVYTDDRPRLSVDVRGEPVTVTVPGAARAGVVELRGFDRGKQIARRRVDVPARR